MNTEIRYVLRNKKTGKLLKYVIQANPEDCEGTSLSYTISEYGDDIWHVDTPEQAEWVRLNHTKWYNAVKETPSHCHNYDPDDYEVVKQVITTEEEKVDI